MGELFADMFWNYARFNVTAKEWYVYNGIVWRADPGAMIVSQYAKDLANALLAYCATIADDRQKTDYLKKVMNYGQLRYRETMVKDLYNTDELICYDVIHPCHYVFHEDTETCTTVHSVYYEEYQTFYEHALRDLEDAKKTRVYESDGGKYPNWFDASYISWLSYDSLNVELPDGYLYFPPIINWGRYREENGRLVMPVTVRMNHAIADGYLVANVFRLLEQELKAFAGR